MAWRTCVFIVQLWFCFSFSELYEGDDCELEHNVQGKCVRLSECPSAIAIIQKREHPVTCGYIGFTPIVCCSVAQNLTRNESSKYNQLFDMHTTQSATIDQIPDVQPAQTNMELPEHRSQPLRASRIPRISEQECLNFQNIELKSEKLNYTDAEGQKLENIYNEIAEFPYWVALGGPNGHGENIVWRCGGSLISDRFVLTTASCQFSSVTVFGGTYNNKMQFVIGGSALLNTYLNVTRSDRNILSHVILRHIPHPLYRPNSVYHDIGLSEVNQLMEFSLHIRPACLYVDQDTDPDTQLISAGWGLQHDKNARGKLHKINLDLFFEDECEITFKDLSGSGRLARGIIHTEQFCAAVHIQNVTQVIETCKNDPGSAVNFNINSTNGKISYIVGIKSFGDSCGLKGVPGVYTRVAAYVPWIESVVWPQSESEISPVQPISNSSEIRMVQQRQPTNSTTTLVPRLSDRKCLYFREAELKERNLIQIPKGGIVDGAVFGGGIVDGAVFGGDLALPDEFPHMVALGFSKSKKEYDITWQCGGSLLSEKFILTAAHCLFTNEFGNLTWAYLGELNLATYKTLQNPEELIYKIKRRIRYPFYKPPATYHDIALVELDRSVVFTLHVRPACLFENHYITTFYSATGWGLTEDGTTDYLQKVVLDTFTNKECEKIYEGENGTRRLPNGIVNNYQFCAGGRSGIQDTCKGDSGGPFQLKVHGYTGNLWHIAGVTSFGKTCGLQGVPGVYVRVSAYVSWIESVIWPDEYIQDQK